MARCKSCGGSRVENDAASGTSFCVDCGTVVTENAIVSEVTFGETGSGAAMVQGSYVGSGSARARMSGPFGKNSSMESREQTIENARRKIHQVAVAMRLPELIAEQAQRYFGLALSTGFVKGRKSLYVVSVCLYIACRFKQTSHMLIDFSDMLQVNVFSLGRTYLDFVRDLNIQKLPLIDPVHYIHRFASLLEFGDETSRVASDAVRLVQRFSRDWMQHGRRPAGICGAALLLAARMNNFRRSVQEIIQVVKIADTTIQKRLDEFKATPSAKLTVQDFRNVTLEEAMDPPAFYQAKDREEKRAKKRQRADDGEDSDEEESDAEEDGSKKKLKKKRSSKKKKRKHPEDELDSTDEEAADDASQRKKRKKDKRRKKKSKGKDKLDDADNEAVGGAGTRDPTEATDSGSRPPDDEAESKSGTPALEIDPALLEEDQRRSSSRASGSQPASPVVPDTQATAVERSSPAPAPPLSPSAPAAAVSGPSSPLFLPSGSPEPEAELNFEAISLPRPLRPALDSEDGPSPTLPVSSDAVDDSFDKLLADEVNGLLEDDEAAAKVVHALNEAEAGRAVAAVDELQGLDEEELDALILSAEEVQLKERIWVEINKDYLQNLAAKMAVESGTSEAQRRKPRKKGQSSKPRDSTNPTGTSAADAARKLAAKKVSKRINYAAFDSLFARAPSESKKFRPSQERSMYRMADDKTDEGMLEIVEDAAGLGVGSVKRSASSSALMDDKDDDAEDYYQEDTSMTMRADAGDGKDDDFGYEEDMYEQEL